MEVNGTELSESELHALNSNAIEASGALGPKVTIDEEPIRFEDLHDLEAEMRELMRAKRYEARAAESETAKRQRVRGAVVANALSAAPNRLYHFVRNPGHTL